MAEIIKTTDFTGKYTISQNQNSNLSGFLTDYQEAVWIKRILGTTEGEAFIADLSGGVPQSAKYLDIFEPFEFELYGCPYETTGLKEILVALFYAAYTKEQTVFNVTGGNSTVSTEAMSSELTKSTVVYNRAASDIDSLQAFIRSRREIYTDYKGICFEYEDIT